MSKHILPWLLLISLIMSTGCLPARQSVNTTVTVTQPTTISTTKSPVTVTVTQTAIIPTTSSTTGALSSTPVIEQITAPTNGSTKVINRTYSFSYGDYNWTWQMEIPEANYDYYKALPRSQTENYSIYVTHPLDDPELKSLADQIQEAATQKGYTDYETVSLAAAFVQNLTYTSDSVTTGFDEYPRYPVETLVDNGGDCEDTAILAASIIRELGYGVILLVFEGTVDSPGHVAVGVKGGKDMSGNYWTYQGDNYYYLETTGTGWEIGQTPDNYQGASAYIYAMIPVPILTHDWETTVVGNQLQLKVTVRNMGSAPAEDVYVYAGFDAGNDQTWNHKESPLFRLDINASIVATLLLTPPVDKHTRLIVQIVYGGYAVDESHSGWYDT